MELNDQLEVYHLRDAVWKAAGMAPFAGFLCVGCLEKRLGRQLGPKDFDTSHDFNRAPGTPRLMERRAKPFKPPGRLPTLDDLDSDLLVGNFSLWGANAARRYFSVEVPWYLKL